MTYYSMAYCSLHVQNKRNNLLTRGRGTVNVRTFNTLSTMTKNINTSNTLY